MPIGSRYIKETGGFYVDRGGRQGGVVKRKVVRYSQNTTLA